MICRELGASIFVRDAFRLDYCLAETIDSVLPICGEIAILDCSSTDGTDAWLLERAKADPRILVRLGEPWEVGTNYDRFAIHANTARGMLTTPWHLMIQADEVLHESSYDAIVEAVAADGWGVSTFRVQRINLYGDFGRQVRSDSERQPCNPAPVRLGRRTVPAVGDAESLLEVDGTNWHIFGRVVMHHYGFVRRGPALIAKVLEVQSWFHGPGATPDPRVVKMQADGGAFRYEDIMADEELCPLTMPHPAVAQRWIKART